MGGTRLHVFPRKQQRVTSSWKACSLGDQHNKAEKHPLPLYSFRVMAFTNQLVKLVNGEWVFPILEWVMQTLVGWW